MSSGGRFRCATPSPAVSAFESGRHFAPPSAVSRGRTGNRSDAPTIPHGNKPAEEMRPQFELSSISKAALERLTIG